MTRTSRVMIVQRSGGPRDSEPFTVIAPAPRAGVFFLQLTLASAPVTTTASLRCLEARNLSSKSLLGPTPNSPDFSHFRTVRTSQQLPILPSVDVDDTPMPTSYAVQTRRMAQKAEGSLPTKPTKSHTIAPVKPTPADDLLEHRRQGHAKSHPDCLDCPMGKLQARRTPFTRSTDSRSPTPAGFRLAGDLKGPLRPDINGNMWHLVLVDMDSKKGYLHSLPRKLSAGIKQGVLQFWADLKKTTGSDIGIAQFHSDDGKEFMGELDEPLLSMGVNRTHTGGYAAKYNVIVEQRIKTLLGRMRANLHMAMGDNDYDGDLAGVALRHANHLINVVPWTNGKCPHETLTGKPYVMDAADKVFGSLVLTYRKKELRRSATSPVATMGIYVGRADEVPGGILVVPIGYDAKVRRWVLDKPEISVDYKADEGLFPLRTQPKEAGSTRTLAQFMETTLPSWYKQEHLDSVGELEIPARSVTTATGVFDVEKILDHKWSKKKGFEYYVQWKGLGPLTAPGNRRATSPTTGAAH